MALVIGAASCGDDELTPEEARYQRVEERLKLSFTDEQAECMLDKFDDSVLISLDGEQKMPQDDAGFAQFQTVAQECILNSGDAPATTSTSQDATPDSEPTTDDTAEPTAPESTTAPAGSEDSTSETTTPSADATGDENGGSNANEGGGSSGTRPETEAPAG